MIYGNDPVESFKSLLKIIKTLRGPEGCPWDKNKLLKQYYHILLKKPMNV